MSTAADKDESTADAEMPSFHLAPSKQRERLRLAFLGRLRSFSAATYFAKPPELSPLICARFGWKNVSVDTLVCEQCRAAWAVVFRPELSAQAAQHLTAAYQEQLSSAHKVSCPFYKQAADYLQQQAVDEQTVLVPCQLASVLPVSTMELLEHPAPLKLFQKRWKNVRSILAQVRSFPAMDIPNHFLYFDADDGEKEKGAAGTESSGSTLLARLVSLLNNGDATAADTTGASSQQMDEAAAALVLLGWDPGANSHDDTNRDNTNDEAPHQSASFECSFCLSRFVIGCADESSSAKEPPLKRTKPANNPLAAHRHYCPILSGFPIAGKCPGTPIWQSLAIRLLQQPDDEEQDAGQSFVDVHKLLQSTVSPRLRRQELSKSQSTQVDSTITT